jgi:myosin heavy subunit
MEWQMGKTKVFMRKKVHDPLEDGRRNLIMKAAVCIQKTYKGYRDRVEYQRKRKAAAKIQAAYRSMKLRLQFHRMRRAAIIIQSGVRGMFAREVCVN